MIGGVLDIASEDRFLSVSHGFVLIRDHQGEIGRVMFDDLTVVILTAHQITISKPLLSALMERGIPLISCGANYLPEGLMLPVCGHHR